MTILILSNENDPHVDFVLPEINKRNLSYLLINTDKYIKDFGLESYIISSKEVHKIDSFNVEDIKSVWFRRPLMPASNNHNLLYKRYIEDELSGYVDYFFGSLKECVWVSQPSNIQRARNKILQLSSAKSEGLKIPNTLMTTNINSFNTFFEENKRKVIIKSIKGHWYDNCQGEDYLFFTSLISSDKLPDKNSLSLAPCMFQEYVEKKVELRSTVIGNQVFTAALYSQEQEPSKIDWRLGTEKVRHEPFKLPEEIEKKLKNLNKHMGLNFGAYDLIITPHDEFVFLEVNPNGQWGWIQERTGLKIKEALVDFLQNGTN
jgi:hypothetical protein